MIVRNRCATYFIVAIEQSSSRAYNSSMMSRHNHRDTQRTTYRYNLCFMTMCMYYIGLYTLNQRLQFV